MISKKLIEPHRKELHRLIDKYGLTHKLTIRQSEKVDRILDQQGDKMFIENYQEAVKARTNDDVKIEDRINDINLNIIVKFAEFVEAIRKIKYEKAEYTIEQMTEKVGRIFLNLSNYSSIRLKPFEAVANESLASLDEVEIIKRIHVAITHMIMGGVSHKKLVAAGILELCRRYKISPFEVMEASIRGLEDDYQK